MAEIFDVAKIVGFHDASPPFEGDYITTGKAVNDMAEAYFWQAQDIMEVLQCSVSKAHKLMAQWNQELAARGFNTMQGRVPRRYAIDRLGIEARAVDEK